MSKHARHTGRQLTPKQAKAARTRMLQSENAAAAQARFVLAREAIARGDVSDGIGEFHAGIDLDPLNADALLELAGAYFRIFDPRHALEACRLAKKCGSTEIQRDLIELWASFYIADLDGKQAALERVAVKAEKVLLAAPDSAIAHGVMSAIRRGGKRFDEAVAHARRATLREPDHWYGWHELGYVLHEHDREIEALDALDRAVALNPSSYATYLCLGTVLTHLELLDDAEAALQRSLVLAPAQWAAHNNLSTVRQYIGDLEGCLHYLDEAVARGASDASKYNRSFALFALGRLEEGWDAYDLGYESGARKPHRQPVKLPVWKGEDISDKTIMVWREQGIGDEVLFFSALPELQQRARHVIVDVSPRLGPLFRRSFPGITVRTDAWLDDDTPRVRDFDVHIGAASLFKHLRCSLDMFPQDAAWLCADPGAVSYWRDRLHDLGPGPKVGVSWRSMLLLVSRLSNYATLDEWSPVFRVPGVTFVNLQYGDRALLEQELQLFEAESGVRIHRWDDIDYTLDIESVAALTAACDVVVGAGNFSVRLAGALGVPTVLVGVGAFPWWTFMGAEDREPMYPRQKVVGRPVGAPWGPSLELAASHLRELVGTATGADAAAGTADTVDTVDTTADAVARTRNVA